MSFHERLYWVRRGKESLKWPRWGRSCKKQKTRRVAARSTDVKSALLCLPRELRDMIYEYTDLLPCKQLLRTVLSVPEPRTEKLWTCEACDNFAFDCYCCRPSLFLVCSQIRDEALDFVFARNLFQFSANDHVMRDLSNLAQVHRKISMLMRPPKDLRCLWAEFLGRLRRLCVSINEDLLHVPTILSSALQNSPELAEIVLIKYYKLEAGVPIEGLLVELAKIPSLVTVKLANGFTTGDDDMVSRITGRPAQLICWCNYGEPWGPSRGLMAESFWVGDVCFAMLGCYIADNLDGPMTKWHAPTGVVKKGLVNHHGIRNKDSNDKEFRRGPSECCVKQGEAKKPK